jgi:hypothetical protein
MVEQILAFVHNIVTDHFYTPHFNINLSCILILRFTLRGV